MSVLVQPCSRISDGTALLTPAVRFYHSTLLIHLSATRTTTLTTSLKLLGMDILDVSDKLGRWSCSDLGSLRSPITTDSKFSLVPLSYS